MKKEKRKVQWNENVDVKEFKKSKVETEIEEEPEEDVSARVESYALDSDDEDEEVVKLEKSRYELTDADKHEELDTGFQDGGVTVTAFNLDEEMEEGFFDESGNYFESKDKNHAGDEWLNDVAPVYVAPKDTKAFKPNFTDDVEILSKDERPGILKTMLELLKTGESVQRALRRLGGSATETRKWQQQKKSKKKPEPKKDGEADPKAFTELTSCADKLASVGEYDIYQYTYEKIAYEVKKAEAEEKFKAEAKAKEEAKASGKPTEAPDDGVVYFEYKWTTTSEVFGPYSAQQMCDWQDQNFFKEGVLCRELKKDKVTEFYNSKRIDFDLYT
eukprot:m.51986 g.51986  ORF g.51986 m.51986 type:complete len:331 (+) comp21528_c0_seq1:151-1143(+)